jgi:hypothetical protein
MFEDLRDSVVLKAHIIGGAKLASELDAKRAIKEGVFLAKSI